MRFLIPISVVGAIVWLIGWPRVLAGPRDSISVTPPGFTNAREPQVAVDSSRGIFIAYGMGNAIYCSSSRDGGRTYGAPVKVGESGALSLGMRRGPRIAITGRYITISAIYGRQGKGRDGELVAWRSGDGGKFWKGPFAVSDVPGAAREGLHAMAGSPGGSLACVWLDLRAGKAHLYSSVSSDGGETWSANRLVYKSPDGSICECCHPSAAYDAKGRLYVMWRNSLGGSRDMYLCHSEDGGRCFSTAEKLGLGTWPLNACPMDGGALSVDRDGKVTTFWRRGTRMYVCAPGKPEREIGEGEQGWIASGGSGEHVVWLSKRRGNLLASRSGQGSGRALAESADDPVVASSSSRGGPIVVVWRNESEGGISSAIITDVAVKGRSK